MTKPRVVVIGSGLAGMSAAMKLAELECDVAVMSLRRRLEFDGKPRVIQTLRGYGYALREVN